jgi:hypothetical protein
VRLTLSNALEAAAPAEAERLRQGEPRVDVSVIVPVTERPDDLADLYREFSQPLREAGLSSEFVFVAEPWYREQTDALAALVSSGEPIRVFAVGQTMGEAALLKIGVAQSRGPVIVTLPAYRRVAASALVDLVERVRDDADMAIARRWPRRDSWINRLQNRGFHMLLGGLARGKVHDVACGVRAMRREVLEDLPLYGDFFRFVPLIALREGYRVDELPTPQHEADTRPRVYGPGLYVRRLIDLLGLFFLLRFTEKPLRFFGLIGGALAMVGGAVLALLLVQRLAGQGIADRPLLLLGVLLLVLGVQAIALGLVGEIIVHMHASRRRTYRLAREHTD